MKTKQQLFAAMLAVLPLLSLSLAAAPVYAQTSVAYAPRITGFNVDEVRRLQPGTELNFDLYGTPGGRATIYIAGAQRNLTLTETDPGRYEGAYTLSSRDRVNAASKVSANLRVGNVVASDILSESLVRTPGRRAAMDRAGSSVRIERFDVQGNDDLNPGSELMFRINGTPGAKVDMAIAGARGVFFLPEVRPGEYEGSYIIRRGDRVVSNSVVTANLRYGDRVTSATLGKPLLIATAQPAATPRVARYCTNCATVEAVNVVQVSGNGNYLGTIGGGVVGALLGSQVGGGNGKTAAQVAGAVGGAYVGRNIERNARKTEHFEVLVRFENGGTQTVTYENDPGLHNGDRVKVNNGVLTRDN